MRILCLEDDPAAAELIQAVLEDSGHESFLRRVETRETFLDALREGGFDLILADYSLPSFDGMAALRLAREHAPDLPFIFISGSLGEEVAVESLKTGATDYLVKGNLSRLVPAIVRALREARDRSDRKLALSYLKVSEERFRLLVENSNDLVAEILLDGTCIYASPNHETILGYRPDGLVSRNLLELIHPEDLGLAQSNLAEERASLTFRIRHADGSWRWLESSGQRFSTSTSERHGVIISRDITERRKSESKIVEQARLLDLATDGIIVCDLDETVRFWNPAAETVYGWSAAEAVGERLPDLLKPDLVAYAEAREQLLNHGRWNGELRFKARSGKEVVVSMRLTRVQDAADKPVSILAIGTDISEKKLLEAQFLRAQRLEGVGLLASGIAHDLNNILSPILMAAPLLRMESLSPENLELLHTIETSANRGAAMVKQILSFTRGTESGRVTMDIRLLLNEIVRLARETFPRSITIESNIVRDLWPIVGEATQLHQVLLNLCINARDAMESGGKLSFSASNVQLGDETGGDPQSRRQLRYVRVCVQDTGTGIPDEIRDKIFEPFFTTKQPGKGTGLGLASVRNIISGHGGFLKMESTPGAGTVFEIHLPSAEGQETTALHGRTEGRPRGNGELILIVDDEVQIREVSRRILEMNGYRVETAGDGVEAIAAFARNREAVEMLITDTDMPNMDGRSLIRVLTRMRPDLKIIASGGRLSEEDRDEFRRLDVSAFLDKPYQPEKLLAMAHDVMIRNGRADKP